MADLIDRQAVLEKLKECAQYHSSDTYSGDIYDAIDEIEAAPAVDAVEVIRCKDCKNYGDEYFCPLQSLADYTDPNDYCSMGERREDDGCM